MEGSRASSLTSSTSRGCVGTVSQEDTEADLRHELEIAQAPTRGRTCGFGDADRRALSAPLIARLRVFNAQDNAEISVDDIDISFLVVAADLWSADGTEDMNLVQHPTSHYMKSTSPTVMEGYRPTSSYEERHRFAYAGGPPSLARPSSSGISAEDMQIKPMAFASAAQNISFGRFPPPISEHGQYRDQGYAELPNRPVSRSDYDGRYEPSFGSPSVNTFAFQAPRPSPPSQYHHLPSEAELERFPSASTSSYLEQPSTSTSTMSSFGPRLATMSTRRPSTGATSIAAHLSSEVVATQKSESEVACVKNLIGAVTTNGHKLKAPGEPGLGIFFVFHDLSVRTEGTFRIRLRLVSIGRQPLGMHTGTQPVLSECLTPPFEVMSAKKFPGMLDPTPMSQAFAKQGLRIPTRKGANRKRRRQEGPEGQERESPTPEDEEEAFS